MKLRWKFSLWVAGLLALVVGSLATLIYVSEKRLLLDEQDRQLAQTIRKLSQVTEESLLESELVLLNYIQELKQDRGFMEAAFLNLNGVAQIHSDPQLIGRQFISPQESQAKSSTALFIQNYVDQNGLSLLDMAYPVQLGGSKVGVARMIFNKEILDAHIASSIKSTLMRIGWMSLVVLFLGILGAFWVSNSMVKPIQIVVNRMQEVAEGRLEPFPELTRKDELGWMAKELNQTVKKLKEVDEMKRDFVSSVTHELRSPLTAIEQMVSLALGGQYGQINPELQESLMIVKNSSIRLGEFVDDLLTTAKLEAKRVDVFIEEFDLRKVLKEVHNLFEPLAQKKGLQFLVDPIDQPILIASDRRRLTQILYNLVSNALKFTSHGQVFLKVEIQGGQISIMVKDSGPGIPPIDLDKIFDKFFRSKSNTDKIKGTGLGLSIVKGFLELIEGTIMVQNNPGGGACFSITIPKILKSAPLSSKS